MAALASISSAHASYTPRDVVTARKLRENLLFSVGVQRQFARTGANGSNGAVLENADSSSTIPSLRASAIFRST
jgi:hypothetical protein